MFGNQVNFMLKECLRCINGLFVVETFQGVHQISYTNAPYELIFEEFCYESIVLE